MAFELVLLVVTWMSKQKRQEVKERKELNGWRGMDDDDPLKKKARVLRGVASMEHRASMGNSTSIVDTNGLPGMKRMFGKDKFRSRTNRIVHPAMDEGKAFLKKLLSFMSFTQDGAIETVEARKQRLTNFVLLNTQDAALESNKIKKSELRRSTYAHVQCGTPLPVDQRDNFIDALPISSSSSASVPTPHAMNIVPCPTSTKAEPTNVGMYPRGSCSAMPSVSEGHDLYYSRPERYNVTAMTNIIELLERGVVLLDAHGHVCTSTSTSGRWKIYMYVYVLIDICFHNCSILQCLPPPNW